MTDGLDCPRCKRPTLGPVVLVSDDVEAEIQQCRKCLGQLFERSSFSAISETPVGYKPDVSRIPEPGKQLIPLTCPACADEKRMMKVQSRRETLVTMDVCGKCGAIWLDGGELEVIRGQETSFARSAFEWMKSKLD